MGLALVGADVQRERDGRPVRSMERDHRVGPVDLVVVTVLLIDPAPRWGGPLVGRVPGWRFAGRTSNAGPALAQSGVLGSRISSGGLETAMSDVGWVVPSFMVFGCYQPCSHFPGRRSSTDRATLSV